MPDAQQSPTLSAESKALVPWVIGVVVLILVSFQVLDWRLRRQIEFIETGALVGMPVAEVERMYGPARRKLHLRRHYSLGYGFTRWLNVSTDPDGKVTAAELVFEDSD